MSKVTFVGDVLTGRTDVNIGQISDECSRVLRHSDLVIGNLEGPLSKKEKAAGRKYSIRSSPESVRLFKSMGFGAFSLSNNHIFDFGEEEFVKTAAILDENGIDHFGAGANLSEARRPLILNVGGEKVGFLGYCWDFTGSRVAAAQDATVAGLDEGMVIEDIRKLRDDVDLVILSVHWGYVNERYPLPSQRTMAHRFIDEGADVIVGHHPHVFQGIEEYRGGLIAYGLGDFLFSDDLTTKMRRYDGSIALVLETVRGTIKGHELIPMRLDENSFPSVPGKSDRNALLQEVRSVSEGFSEEDYYKFWRERRTRKDLPDLGKDSMLTTVSKNLYRSKGGRFILRNFIS